LAKDALCVRLQLEISYSVFLLEVKEDIVEAIKIAKASK
jgi:hypothetical protein